MHRLLRPLWVRLEGSPISYRLARGAFWSLVGTVASRAFVLVASAVTARLLGKEDFGALGIIQTTTGMFGAFAGFGLGLTATKHLAEFRRTDPERASRVLSMSTVMCWTTGTLAAIILVLAAPWLATSSLAAPHLSNELRIGAAYLLLTTVNGGQMGALAGFEAFQRVATVNLWFGVLSIPLAAAGCWFFGLAGAVWGLAASQGAVCWFSRCAILKEARTAGLRPWSRDWRLELPVVLRFSLPTFLSQILAMPVYWVCQAFLAQQARGYEKVADFYTAMQLRNIPMAIVGVMISAVLPVCASAKGEQTRETQDKVLRLTWIAMVCVVFPMLALMAAFAQPLLLIFGKKFLSGEAILRLLLISVAIESMANRQIQVMIGNGQVWQLFLCYLLGACGLLGMAFALIPSHSGAGLAWAMIGWQAIRWLGGRVVLWGHRARGAYPTEPSAFDGVSDSV